MHTGAKLYVLERYSGRDKNMNGNSSNKIDNKQERPLGQPKTPPAHKLP